MRERCFRNTPNCFRKLVAPSILKGIVEVGMTPFEAKLAGGAFAYKVVADSSRWPEHSNPLEVMWAQSRLPDKSEIWMVFKNKTQFSENSESSFRVYFEKGHATKIIRLKD